MSASLNKELREKHSVRPFAFANLSPSADWRPRDLAADSLSHADPLDPRPQG